MGRESIVGPGWDFGGVVVVGGWRVGRCCGNVVPGRMVLGSGCTVVPFVWGVDTFILRSLNFRWRRRIALLGGTLVSMMEKRWLVSISYVGWSQRWIVSRWIVFLHVPESCAPIFAPIKNNSTESLPDSGRSVPAASYGGIKAPS